MIRIAFVLAGIAVLSAACSNVRSRIPFVYQDQKVTADQSASYQWDPHRQYFDKLHKRYYYYDQDRKQYFWENGQPKS